MFSRFIVSPPGSTLRRIAEYRTLSTLTSAHSNDSDDPLHPFTARPPTPSTPSTSFSSEIKTSPPSTRSSPHQTSLHGCNVKQLANRNIDIDTLIASFRLNEVRKEPTYTHLKATKDQRGRQKHIDEDFTRKCVDDILQSKFRNGEELDYRQLQKLCKVLGMRDVRAKKSELQQNLQNIISVISQWRAEQQPHGSNSSSSSSSSSSNNPSMTAPSSSSGSSSSSSSVAEQFSSFQTILLVNAYKHTMQKRHSSNKFFTTISHTCTMNDNLSSSFTTDVRIEPKSVVDLLELQAYLSKAPKVVIMDILERAVEQHEELPNVLNIQRPLLRQHVGIYGSGSDGNSSSDECSVISYSSDMSGSDRNMDNDRDSYSDSNSGSNSDRDSDSNSNSDSDSDSDSNRDGDGDKNTVCAQTPPVPPRGKFTVCGDTHGQFADLLNIFRDEVGGFPSEENPFLFNGDMVDRGDSAFEIVLSLVLLKLSVPSCMHMLRGNHETNAMNEHYGFAQEVLRKQDHEVLSKFRELFRVLPVAAVIDDSVFVVHGGIGRQSFDKSIAMLNDEEYMNRKVDEPSLSSPLSELLWSDPRDGIKGFKRSPRGGGTQLFGMDASDYFLRMNNLQLLVRSHEVQMNGFEVHHDGRVVTVFSAPNYCGVTGNLGAIIRFDCVSSMDPKVIQFRAASASASSSPFAAREE